MSMPDPIVPPAANPAMPQEKKKRGFATMNPDLVRELARRGGAAAHRAGTAHEFTPDEARVAGRKGGIAAHAASRGQAPESTGPIG